MAYSTVCTDSFNRANGNLSGSTLDNANGGSESDTWTIVVNTFAILSNQAKGTTSLDNGAIVSSTAAVADMKVSVKFMTPRDSGVIARWTTGTGYGNNYLAYVDSGGTPHVTLYKVTNSSASALGAAGSTGIAAGDTISIECVGTTINVYINGSLELTRTDATWTSGKPGMYGGGNGGSLFDDFKYEIPVSGTTVNAGLGVLTVTGFAPAITQSNNQNVLAGVGAATLTGFAAAISQSNNQNVAAGAGVATLTGFASTVFASNKQTVLPGVGLASLTGFAPSVATTANQFVAAGFGAATLSGFAPLVSVGNVAAPGVGLATVTGFAATISQSNSQNVLANVGVATLNGFAPSVFASNRQNVLAAVGLLTLAGFAPNVVAGATQSIFPGVGLLALTGFAPTVGSGPAIILGPRPIGLAARSHSTTLAARSSATTLTKR